MLFNAVALSFFFGEFLANPQLGLPTIPDVLVGLTGVSAIGYATKKALPDKARNIKAVDPPQISLAQAQAETTLSVYGSNLLNADGSAPEVHFVNAAEDVKASNVLEHTTAEGLVVDAVVAVKQLKVGTYNCVVITTEGNKVIGTDALKVVA